VQIATPIVTKTDPRAARNGEFTFSPIKYDVPKENANDRALQHGTTRDKLHDANV
jgi:hypothetical protein